MKIKQNEDTGDVVFVIPNGEEDLSVADLAFTLLQVTGINS